MENTSELRQNTDPGGRFEGFKQEIMNDHKEEMNKTEV